MHHTLFPSLNSSVFNQMLKAALANFVTYANEEIKEN